MVREQLRHVVEDNTTRWGRVFDYFIQGMILVSLIAYAIGTLPNNSPRTNQILRGVEIFSVVIFTIEYILRVYVAEKPRHYMFSFYGMIDFIAVAPFYFTASGHLLSLRALRVFRILRALKLVRYNAALNRFNVAFRIVKEEIVLFLIVTGILLFLASAGIYYFENDAQPEVFSSVFSSAWWAVATLTTVGYGDVYPITIGGKLFTFFVLLVGVGIVTIPAGLVASALTKARELEDKAGQKEDQAIEQLAQSNAHEIDSEERNAAPRDDGSSY